MFLDQFNGQWGVALARAYRKSLEQWHLNYASGDDFETATRRYVRKVTMNVNVQSTGAQWLTVTVDSFRPHKCDSYTYQVTQNAGGSWRLTPMYYVLEK